MATEYKVKAIVRLNGSEIEVPAINPGAWSGKCWLISCAASGIPVCVVEADSLCDAEEEFIESDMGESFRINPDDYPADNNAPEWDEWQCAGNGIWYDSSGILIDGDESKGVDCTYVGKPSDLF